MVALSLADCKTSPLRRYTPINQIAPQNTLALYWYESIQISQAMCRPSTDDRAVATATQPQANADPQSKLTTQNGTIEQSKADASTSRDDLRRGTILGSLSLALLIASFSLTMPHLQSRRDALGCDSLCLGSMTSARSALSLVGSALVGRLSDSDSGWLARVIGGGSGRRACLYVGSAATMAGLAIAAGTDSILGLWLSMIPGALLQQNFSVTKAVLSDYHEAIGATFFGKNGDKADASARAGSVGKLGMAVGLAFMVGPLAGAALVKTYGGAVKLAMFFTLLSGILASQLPRAKRVASSSTQSEKKSGFLSFADVKAARSPPAIFIMATRISMALAFHIFHTIWTVSLKSRFDFGPSDHGRFMSFIGLTYAVSQGLVAKRVLKMVGQGSGRVRLMQVCCLLLGLGRYLAFQTASLPAVYAMFAFIVTGLGVLNTILTADASGIASSDEVGGLFGVLEAVESVAGMVGPVLGGALALVHPVNAPLYSVVGLYGVVFVLVSLFYERLLLSASKKSEGKKTS